MSWAMIPLSEVLATNGTSPTRPQPPSGSHTRERCKRRGKEDVAERGSHVLRI